MQLGSEVIIAVTDDGPGSMSSVCASRPFGSA
jgi:hypothetical protein